MPNLRLVGISSLYYILLVDSMGKCTIGFVKKGGTCVLNMVRLAICRHIVLLSLLRNQKKFLLSLYQLLHQKVLLLFLVSALAKIACMLFLPLRYLPMSLLVCYGYFLLIWIACLCDPICGFTFLFWSQVYPNPFSVSTLVGEYVVSRRVYWGCAVFVGGTKTLVDLIE